MKFFKFIFFHIFLFLFMYVNAFCKKLNITFNFDIPNGFVYYSEKINPIPFKNFKISLELEKGKYNFLFHDKHNHSINKEIFISKNKNYNINFSNKKKIQGKILDENLKPVSNSQIELINKMTKKRLITTSDKYGNFLFPYHKGINIIKIDKPGYSPKIIIRNFSNSSSSNPYILYKSYYSFSGTVINDIYPIDNLPVYLFSKKGILLKKTNTNVNGEFSMFNIPTNSFYIFIPETKKFKNYKSNFIKINTSTNNFCIKLKER